MVPVLVDVLEQGLATHLLLAMVGHRELHLGQFEITINWWYHKNIGRSFMYFGGVDSTLLSEMSWGKGV